jgi:hypothetical protein
MSLNEQRLTANELELKNEVSALVKQFNEKVFELSKTGVTVNFGSKPFNDGLTDFYVGLSVNYSLNHI